MIVVTGSPGSGTSLMMQTLILLHYPVVGEVFAPGKPRELNQKGYWELPVDEEVKGINSSKYLGKAVKLLGVGLLKTNPELIDKVILCRRRLPECIDSAHRYIQSTGKFWGLRDDQLTVDVAAAIVRINLRKSVNYLIKNGIEYKSVWYEDMINKPEESVYGIAEFIGCVPQLTAMSNVGV